MAPPSNAPSATAATSSVFVVVDAPVEPYVKSSPPTSPTHAVAHGLPLPRAKSGWNYLLFGQLEGGRLPPATAIIILGCLGGFGYSIRQGTLPFRENPLVGPSRELLVSSGAKVTSLILEGEWYRVFTSCWLHAGVLHLLVNLFVIFLWGRMIERLVGPVRLLLLFIAVGCFSVLTSVILLPNYMTVGASGAAFGLLGALLSHTVVNWTMVPNRCLFFCCCMADTVLCALPGFFVPFVDNASHLGGLVGGILLGVPLMLQVHGRAGCGLVTALLVAALALGAFITLFVLMALNLSEAIAFADECSWCPYLTCIPTSWTNCTS